MASASRATRSGTRMAAAACIGWLQWFVEQVGPGRMRSECWRVSYQAGTSCDRGFGTRLDGETVGQARLVGTQAFRECRVRCQGAMLSKLSRAELGRLGGWVDSRRAPAAHLPLTRC